MKCTDFDQVNNQFEGTPFFPNNDRFWQVIDKYEVNQFYTAPTAIRALMKFGDEPVLRHSLKSLRCSYNNIREIRFFFIKMFGIFLGYSAVWVNQ